MNLCHRLWLAAVFAVVLAPLPARAILISGTFSGTADAYGLPLGFEPPHPESYYDGAPVTGGFIADFRDPQFQVGGDGYAYYFNGPGGSMTLDYAIKDVQFSFVDTDISVMLLENHADGSTQSVTFMSNIMPKYDGGSFSISGPVGSLFDALSPSTVHVEPGAPYAFRTSFASATAEMRFSIDLASVDLNVATPVPEPAINVLLLSGGLLLAWRARRRKEAVVQ